MRPDFYDTYFDAETKHWWCRGRAHILMSVLDRAVGSGSPRHRRILDVGCGTGAMTARLARFGTTEGIDEDPKAVELCSRRGLASVRQVSGLPLPYGADEFHVVTALDVLEHLDDDDAMLREISRVLRPGGTLLVSVPAYRFLWGQQDVIAQHRRRYTSSELGSLLTRSGLAVRRLSYFNTLLFPAVASVRIMRRWLGTASRPKSDFEMGLPQPLNEALARVFAMEALVLAHRDLPFGVSVLGIAEKLPSAVAT